MKRKCGPRRVVSRRQSNATYDVRFCRIELLKLEDVLSTKINKWKSNMQMKFET
ncbi:uncharacterized protein DS421_17g599830 [Arachis hypogaea]|nr:uncharacterized protein DS421_17g599830 [Arachis hypogaea]